MYEQQIKADPGQEGESSAAQDALYATTQEAETEEETRQVGGFFLYADSQ